MARLRRINRFNIIYGILGGLAGLLAVRLILKLFFVESNQPFAGAVYFLTGWLVSPFQRLLKISEPLPGAFFELYTLVTLLVVGMSGLIVAIVATAWKKNNYPKERGDPCTRTNLSNS
jgi:hypothetical protein